MKILMINSVCGIRSTGRICTDISKELIQKGHVVRIAYARGVIPSEFSDISYKICSKYDVYKQVLASRILDNEGFGNKKSTLNFLNWIEKFNPDIIHLHNLHGYYLNIDLLFNYLKNSNKKIIWTLHDCWPFTGHCAYFDSISCQKWMTGCEKCKLKKSYPASYIFDNSNKNYNKKIELYSNIDSMEIVTPSDWLSSLTSKSILGNYCISTIHNGVNTNIFRNRPSDFRSKYSLDNKIVVLGVAAIWSERKGLNIFNNLADRLSDDYKIVLVGVNDEQAKCLNSKIICIKSTNKPEKLAEIYSASDIYVNPTFADNYPTTNIEAIACGTPVITFNTGGSPESAKLFGCVVEKGDEDMLYHAICNYKSIVKTDNIRVDYQFMVNQYINLYERVYNDKDIE